jgi:serine/threonine-protein kinase SRPK3
MPCVSSFVTHLSRPFSCVRTNAPREICRGSAREIPTYNSLRMASDLTPAPNASQATYQFIDESVEPFEGYTAGGYYPLQIGHRLGPLQRYHIIHKLGHGGSSTIWLGLDERMARYVAVKIAVSDLDRPFESSILRSLLSDKEGTCNTQAGIATIPAILDEFEVKGPEIEGSRRKHHCLVTKPARMSLAEAREVSDRRLFQPLVAHAIAAQLIQAVAFLHSRGIVHAGK